jgi:hypothetical protein
MKFVMNHNHIYSDPASCEQLKAVDIIFKEEGHVCPTSPRTPPPTKKINNKKQTKNIQILYILAVPAITFLEILGTLLIECLSVSIDSVSTLASMFRVDLMLSHYSMLCEAVY